MSLKLGEDGWCVLFDGIVELITDRARMRGHLDPDRDAGSTQVDRYAQGQGGPPVLLSSSVPLQYVVASSIQARDWCRAAKIYQASRQRHQPRGTRHCDEAAVVGRDAELGAHRGPATKAISHLSDAGTE